MLQHPLARTVADSKHQTQNSSKRRTSAPCRARSQLRAVCYCGDALTNSTVRRIAPDSDMHATEQAIKTFGQAYMMHSLQRQLHTRLGKEQEVFAGLSRMMLDKFSHDQVLYITDCGKAAAIVLTNQQQASLLEDLRSMDFSIIPGTLQMLVAIPQDSMPKVTSEVEEVYAAGLAAVKQNLPGYTGVYQQIMLIGVQPEVQDQGLGSALIRGIVQEAEQQQQPLVVEVTHEDWVRFFEKFGFRELGERDWRPIMLRQVQHSTLMA